VNGWRQKPKRTKRQEKRIQLSGTYTQSDSWEESVLRTRRSLAASTPADFQGATPETYLQRFKYGFDEFGWFVHACVVLRNGQRWVLARAQNSPSGIPSEDGKLAVLIKLLGGDVDRNHLSTMGDGNDRSSMYSWLETAEPSA
jgi:hypothetical protein